MKVAVVGGGIGGLAVAVGLQRRGHSVMVFEKDRDADKPGSGLALFGNASRAAQALGFALPHEQHAFPELTLGHLDSQGRRLSTLPRRTASHLNVVRRSTLQHHLLALLESGTVRFGHAATVATDGKARIHLTGTTNAEVLDFDLVVAADGINSPSRQKLGLPTRVRHTGYSTWRGITSHPVDLRGAAGESWGSRRRFGYLPLADGCVYWFGVAPSLSTLTDSPREEARALFGAWHAPISEILTATHEDSISRHGLRQLDVVPDTYVVDRTVLLGDAAHAMLPDLGQGAGQALEDAATLVALLEQDNGSVGDALSTYDRLRRKRTKQVKRAANAAAVFAKSEAWGSVLLRNYSLRLVPNFLLGKVIDRVQAWDADLIP